MLAYQDLAEEGFLIAKERSGFFVNPEMVAAKPKESNGTVAAKADYVVADDAPDWLPENPQHGTRLPVQRQAQQWLATSLQILERGSLVIFDYCMTSRHAASLPWRDWLRTYRQHKLGEHYLSQPGEQDITNHLMLDQLEMISKPSSISSQSGWLVAHGLNVLVDEGRDYWQANASKPDLFAMLMRSRISEAEALTSLDGLGKFNVIEWIK